MSNRTKAIIFTHLPMTLEEARSLAYARTRFAFTKNYARYFKAYLKCSNIGLVYVYVDTGSRLVNKQLLELMRESSGDVLTGPAIGITLEELELEQRARNCLELLVDQAVSELVSDEQEFDSRNAPRFQFVGLPHLTSLLCSLQRINPVLLQNIAGGEDQFSYDIPKFVEAVIRLARGQSPLRALNPILRFDVDVEVNQEGIDKLLAAVRRGDIDGRRLEFFSGEYGDPEGAEDPLSDYAVRLAWLVHWEFKENAVNGVVGRRADGQWALSDHARSFLRDIGEIGATQLPSHKSMSDAMKKFITEKRNGRSSNRESAQVISGAGLYMSLAAIEQLPPFMNVDYMTSLADDHLKRRLHEAAGDLPEQALERTGAKFRQYRHYTSEDTCIITDADIVWHVNHYFERLLRECIVHALIVEPNGKPGLLSREVLHILNYEERMCASDEQLINMFEEKARKTAEDILGIWVEANYGDCRLSDWASQILKSRYLYISRTTATDMAAYVRLVRLWPDYVKAVAALQPVDAHWLFRMVY